MKTAYQTFIETFNSITVEVEMKPEFSNGTGYFNGLVTEFLDLPVGTRFKAVALCSGRKIIGVVTPVGNVVFFERYTGGEHGIIVQNLPRALTGLYISGSVDQKTLFTAMGSEAGHNHNIGQVLASVLKEAL